MSTAAELMFDVVNWKIPKLAKGDYIRFNYWSSDFDSFAGHKGYVIGIRYLSSKPLKRKDKDITRGNVLYVISLSKYGCRSFYIQRMSSVEKIQKK